MTTAAETKLSVMYHQRRIAYAFEHLARVKPEVLDRYSQQELSEFIRDLVASTDLPPAQPTPYLHKKFFLPDPNNCDYIHLEYGNHNENAQMEVSIPEEGPITHEQLRLAYARDPTIIDTAPDWVQQVPNF
jgi:hypothetical protein